MQFIKTTTGRIECPCQPNGNPFYTALFNKLARYIIKKDRSRSKKHFLRRVKSVKGARKYCSTAGKTVTPVGGRLLKGPFNWPYELWKTIYFFSVSIVEFELSCAI